MHKLTIVPFGGLGNRMRVLTSLYQIKQNFPFDLEIGWFKNKELNSGIDELFSDIGLNYSLLSGLKAVLFPIFIKISKVNRYPTLYKLVLQKFYDKVYLDHDCIQLNSDEIILAIKASKTIFIATCYPLIDVTSYNHLKLNSQIESKVISLQISESYIGIHIRRGDHIEIIKESSLEKYENVMLNHISRNNHQKFYLASDDVKVKAYFKNKYKEKILTNELNLDRANQQGVQDALIDIYMLSAAEKIICNPKSSFAIMASQIGNKKELFYV
jgi:hypothetical protein